MRAERERRRAQSVKRFEVYREDPVGFIENSLLGFVWSKQREICESVLKNRFTAVKSCHSVGKTAIAARIGAWWLSVHPPGEAFLVTSAPTGNQVRALLWREINAIHRAGGLPGRTNQTEWLFEPNELVGFGKSVKDTDPTAIQGVHARRVLVIFDEACGMSTQIWDAAETLIANDDSRMLAIGNPDDPATEFGRSCKPGTAYHVIQIGAFDSPNFTDEQVPEWLRPLLVSKVWVEERRKKWGEDSNLWKSKVRGEFPDQSSDGLVPLIKITEAVNRSLRPGRPVELGVDVARFGDDSTVIYVRRGPVFRKLLEMRNRDTMKVTGAVVAAIKKTGATAVKIDDIGIGGGVTDRLRELRSEGKFTAEVCAINVSEACRTTEDAEKFTNLRAELNWAMRERFVEDLIDIEDEDAEGQAGEVKYFHSSRGAIQIESKEKMKKRGLPSPDHWDAMVLANAPPEYGAQMAMTGQEAEFLYEPFNVPLEWPRVFGLDVNGNTVSAVWGAWDEPSDTVYLYGEYKASRVRLETWVSALRKRGDWVPGIFDLRARRRNQDQGERLADRMADEKLFIYTAEADAEAMVEEVETRVGVQQLRVASIMTNWRDEYRNYKRDKKGNIVQEEDGLLHATGLLLVSGLTIAMVETSAQSSAMQEWEDRERNSVTGY